MLIGNHMQAQGMAGTSFDDFDSPLTGILWSQYF